MIQNYITTALRCLLKHKSYSIVNLLGLAIGICAFLLMALYVQYEYSYDKFNQNYKEIYRIECKQIVAGEENIRTAVPNPLAQILTKEYPEIISSVRIDPIRKAYIFKDDEKSYIEEMGLYSEDSFFKIFSYKIVKGNIRTPLSKPNTIVISENLAKKYFPDGNALGKLLNINNEFSCEITAIIENPTKNSHLDFNYIISLSTKESKYLNDWNFESHTYILTDKNIQYKKLENKIKNIIGRYIDNNTKKTLYIKPLSDLHFSLTMNEISSSNSSKIVIFLFNIIALFTLLIACMNFVNLTMAYYMNRLKEIGIRKLIGASKKQLLYQIIFEAVLLSSLSAIAAFIFAKIFLSYYNGIINRELSINFHDNWIFLTCIIFIAIAFGVISVIYPSLIISRSSALQTLKGDIEGESRIPLSKKLLVISQFIISIILIIIALVFPKQLEFMKNKDYGFNRLNILEASFKNTSITSITQFEALKNELLQNPYIIKATVANSKIFNNAVTEQMIWEGSENNGEVPIFCKRIDYDFIDTYNIKITEGRNFSKKLSNHHTCLINIEATKKFNWKSPLGKTIIIKDKEYEVIGVVNNFNIYSVALPVAPLVLVPYDSFPQWNTFSIKISSDKKITEVKDYVTKKFREYGPKDNFEFKLLSDGFDKEFFDIVDNVGDTFVFFSFLAIFLASIGLYSLVSFTTKQRTKEICIRKIMGASKISIAMVFIRFFGKILIVSLIIGVAIAYILLTNILQNFDSRINLNVSFIIYGGLIVLIVALISIMYHVIKVANMNPVDALSYE